jgi:enamine deaminase RidA (YjgF/YER057c/UK114 family)
MTRTLISSGSPLEPVLGYSRAVVQGDWCFVAGTTGPDPDTRVMPEDVRDQTRNAFTIIEHALAEGGFALTDVVRATYYITQMDYHDIIAPILGEKFGQIRPAATCIVVAGLVHPDMKVEIEVTAMRAPR